ncbi:efflux RND transporter periplasmic adaptor subunit [Aureliella helgolandensis]|uniref:Multidrug efflux system subunit MdtA n=1 Tax=Aureliella helgolandensis TaxID=2527968 RepID=A0A518GA16_9BACT|nr:HlyD family efflux transporter periplasmic adaptor subunit [Aureliella helgolandensis]QDV25438.1 multidrug efflux system subunit MdtA [Aureliella helgolandensis]
MATPNIDLSQLALERPEVTPAAESAAAGKAIRRWLVRYGLPAAILLGFSTLFLAALGFQLTPITPVEVTPVVVKRNSAPAQGTPLFQAPGWIEPCPTAINVAALAPGVIEELLVVEGQAMTAGDPVARLIPIDSEIELEQAQVRLAIQKAELKRAEAARNAAQIRLAQPVHLQVQLADAQSMLAKTQTELAKLPFQIEAATADARFLKESLDGKNAARSAIAAIVVKDSEREYAAADAVLRELKQRGPNLQQEADALQAKVDALQTQADLLVEEHRQFEEAEANVSSQTALLKQAAVRLRLAELAVERNMIRAPISGRILRILAVPGTRVMGLDSIAGQSSSTVAEMYDPASLQVRVDVRLEEVPLVIEGQQVRIQTASYPSPLQGIVLQTTSSASIQKNTLEVKVKLLDPPRNVSPEMLVTATFLSAAISSEETQNSQEERLFVPSQLVKQAATGEEQGVWIVDADNRAQFVPLQLGQQGEDGLVEVQKGLSITDKIIASDQNRLHPGMRVHITAQDSQLGLR